MTEDRRLVTLTADWLRPGVVVVGHLEIWMSGLVFRSLIPNADRSLELVIAAIDRVTSEGSHRLDVWRRDGEPLRFLTTEPKACVLALEQAIAVHRASTAYR